METKRPGRLVRAMRSTIGTGKPRQLIHVKVRSEDSRSAIGERVPRLMLLPRQSCKKCGANDRACRCRGIDEPLTSGKFNRLAALRIRLLAAHLNEESISDGFRLKRRPRKTDVR